MGMIKNEADVDRAEEVAAMLECVVEMDKEKLKILNAGLLLCKDDNEKFAFQNGIDSTNGSIRFFESNIKLFQNVKVS